MVPFPMALAALAIYLQPKNKVLALSSATSTRQIGSGLTLLSDNDLLNNPRPGTGAVFLDNARNFSSAEAACRLLGEGMWSAEGGVGFPLKPSLSYLAYQGLVERDQLLWVARSKLEGRSASACEAVDLDGNVRVVSCDKRLPILCTQSAPVSNATFANKTTTYQISHQAGDLTLTGFRDFYTWKFLGIRYAPQPERFEWSTVWRGSGSASALNFGPDCPQQPHDFPGPFSEDCLFLSIWTPHLPQPKLDDAAKTDAGKKGLRPVMLYLYGGGLHSGSTTNPHTDCTNLASRGDIVCVAINYRVGNLGFLVLDDGVHRGNYGLQDMITALQWVQQNIQSFGGDPSSVTIFGESGGADGIRALLASPKATGLFSRAVLMSAASGLSSYGPLANYSSVQTQYNRVTQLVLNMTGCATAVSPLVCLKEYDAEGLVTLGYQKNGDWALAANSFYPVVDGYILTSDGIAALHGGPKYAAGVSVMTGTNRDEFGILLPAPGKTTNGTEYIQQLSSALGSDVSLLFQLVSLPIPVSAEDAFNLLVRIGTDGAFRCLDQALAASAARHGSFAAIYRFEFNRTYQVPRYTNRYCSAPRSTARPFGDPDAEYLKCHAGEKIYVFGNLCRDRDMPDRDGRDGRMSQFVLDQWASFARTGDPNPNEGYLQARGYGSTAERIRTTERWEPVVADRPQMRLQQWNAKQVDFADSDNCDALGFPLNYYDRT